MEEPKKQVNVPSNEAGVGIVVAQQNEVPSSSYASIVTTNEYPNPATLAATSPPALSPILMQAPVQVVTSPNLTPETEVPPVAVAPIVTESLPVLEVTSTVQLLASAPLTTTTTELSNVVPIASSPIAIVASSPTTAVAPCINTTIPQLQTVNVATTNAMANLPPLPPSPSANTSCETLTATSQEGTTPSVTGITTTTAVQSSVATPMMPILILDEPHRTIFPQVPTAMTPTPLMPTPMTPTPPTTNSSPTTTPPPIPVQDGTETSTQPAPTLAPTPESEAQQKNVVCDPVRSKPRFRISAAKRRIAATSSPSDTRATDAVILHTQAVASSSEVPSTLPAVILQTQAVASTSEVPSTLPAVVPGTTSSSEVKQQPQPTECKEAPPSQNTSRVANSKPGGAPIATEPTSLAQQSRKTLKQVHFATNQESSPSKKDDTQAPPSAPLSKASGTGKKGDKKEDKKEDKHPPWEIAVHNDVQVIIRLNDSQLSDLECKKCCAEYERVLRNAKDGSLQVLYNAENVDAIWAYGKREDIKNLLWPLHDLLELKLARCATCVPFGDGLEYIKSFLVEHPTKIPGLICSTLKQCKDFLKTGTVSSKVPQTGKAAK